MSLHLIGEHHLYRGSIDGILQKFATPNLDEWEKKGHADLSLWRTLGEADHFRNTYPESQGGYGLDIFYDVILCESLEMNTTGGVSAGIWAHKFLPLKYLSNLFRLFFADILEGGLNGSTIMALAMTGPNAGSDLRATTCKAIKIKNKWKLNGSKMFITNGGICESYIVAAKTNIEDRKLSIFYVPANLPGIKVDPALDKLGWRGSDTRPIHFDDVELPEEYLLGEIDSGMDYLGGNLVYERLMMAVVANAQMEKSLKIFENYTTDRNVFGKPIIHHQIWKQRYAEMFSRFNLNRKAIYAICAEYGKVPYNISVRDASCAKNVASLMAVEIADMCLQGLGGYGYMKEYEIERVLRDCRLNPIGGGTVEILNEVIYRIITGKSIYKNPFPIS